MNHFPFLHKYKAIKVFHYYDISWGGRSPSTCITYKCVCGKIKTKNLYGVGYLNLEELL